MKRLGYILTGMLAVLVLAGGCFITDHTRIVQTTPYSQDAMLDGTNIFGGYGGPATNLPLTAHIIEGSSVATIWGDGYTTEYVHFIDVWNGFPEPVAGECDPDCCTAVREALLEAEWSDEYVAMDFLSKWANSCKHIARGKNLGTAANGLCTLLNHLDAQEGKKISEQSADAVRAVIQAECVVDDGIELPCDDALPKGEVDVTEQTCITLPIVINQTWASVNVGHTPSINYFHMPDTMCDMTLGDCGRRVMADPLRRFQWPLQDPYPDFSFTNVPTGNPLCDRQTPGVLLAGSTQPNCSQGWDDYGIDAADFLRLLSTAQETEEGLVLTFTADNTSITLQQGELSKELDLGEAEFTFIFDQSTMQSRTVFDLTDGRNMALLVSYREFLSEAQPGSFTTHLTHGDFSASIPNFGIDAELGVAKTIDRYIAEVEAYGVDQKGLVNIDRAGRSFF